MSESWEWGRLRQSAAERVLNRHLQDQHEVAEVQAAFGRHHHRHQHRNRTSSVFVSQSSEEVERPKTRRHSIPAPYATESRKGKLLTKRQSLDESSDDVIWSKEDLRLQRARDRMTEVSKDEEFADDIMARVGERSRKGSPNLLDQMRSTLETARMMEEQRKSFPLNRSAGKQQQQQQQQQHSPQQQRKYSTSKHQKSLDAQNSGCATQEPPAAIRRISVEKFHIPRLMREETFIHTDKAQILSLHGEIPVPVADDVAAITAQPTNNGIADSNGGPPPKPCSTNVNGSDDIEVSQPKKNFLKTKDSVSKPIPKAPSKPDPPNRTKNNFTKSDVISTVSPKNDVKATTNGAPKPKLRQQFSGNVQVEFFDEDKGLPKPPNKGVESLQGPIDPQTLSIPLHLLNDDESGNDGVNKENDVSRENEDKVTADAEVKDKGKMLFMEADGESAWDQARKCHYIRGYDPPDMRMPKDFAGFVFKEGENNTNDEQ